MRSRPKSADSLHAPSSSKGRFHEERHPRAPEDRGPPRRRGDGDAARLARRPGRRPALADLALDARTSSARSTTTTCPPARRSCRRTRGTRTARSSRSSTGRTRSRRSTGPPCGSPGAAAEGEYVYVAGVVGPLGQLVKPYGPLTRPHVREIFTEQIRILLEEKVDLLLFETFSSSLEILEAVRAARALSTDIPVVASMTFLADGKTSFGDEAAESARARSSRPAPTSSGLNCAIGPQESLDVLTRAAASRFGAPFRSSRTRATRGSSAGRTVYPATPDYFRETAKDAVQAGAALLADAAAPGPSTSPRWRARPSARRAAPRTTAARLSSRRAPARPEAAPLETSAFKRKLGRPLRPRRHGRGRAPEGLRRLGRAGRRARAEDGAASTPSTSRTTRWRA